MKKSFITSGPVDVCSEGDTLRWPSIAYHLCFHFLWLSHTDEDDVRNAYLSH